MWLNKYLIGAFLLLLQVGAADAANRFGVCTTTCTWDGASTAMWSTTSGGGTGASVPGNADAVIFDAATCVGGTTCTITVNVNVDVQSITMGACTGSTTGCILDFSVNNNTVALNQPTGFSGTGTGTRTLKMGNGTWTLSSVTAAWSIGLATNMTLTANSSTIVFSATGSGATGRAFTSVSGLTYNIVTLGPGDPATTVSGPFTVATLNFTAPCPVWFASGVTVTVTNAFNFAGSSANQNFISSNSAASQATISVASGTPTMSWTGVREMAFTGGATFTATNSFDLKGNTGITITPPATGGGGKIIGG